MKDEVIFMSRPVLLVSSVTFAIKGQNILREHGISSKIIRNADLRALSGCGYGIYAMADPHRAQSILSRGGVEVLRVVRTEVGQ